MQLRHPANYLFLFLVYSLVSAALSSFFLFFCLEQRFCVSRAAGGGGLKVDPERCPAPLSVWAEATSRAKKAPKKLLFAVSEGPFSMAATDRIPLAHFQRDRPGTKK